MWTKRPLWFEHNGRQACSVVFTFHLPEVRRAILEGNLFHRERPIVGGPAVKLMPDYLADIAEIGSDIFGMLQRHNPMATRTTLGCPRKCGFCAVPKIEGDFVELADWPDLPIVCDNNLLYASRPHFDKVIDRLKRHKGVDFNQGLDARLLTDYHAGRLAEVDGIVRLAWDNMKSESGVMAAVERLKHAGIPKRRIQCYVLIGFKDTPEDALYRLRRLQGIGVRPNPMRFTPIDSTKVKHVALHWTEKELVRFMRYWANLRFTSSVPFEEFERVGSGGHQI